MIPATSPRGQWVNNFACIIFQHVNEITSQQFEEQTGVEGTLDVMNHKVLPALNALSSTPYQDDTSAVEEIREKWCSFLAKDLGKFASFRHIGFVNTLRPRQNGRHFADDIFKCIFLTENVWIPIKISLKFVPMGPINNIPALV